MYKQVFGAKRKPGMSREDFERYWTTTHADLARKVPGIRRYVINIAARIGDAEREMAYDGFAEAWFDDLESMRASGRSAELRAVRDDEKNLFDLPTAFAVIVQEHVMIG
ncbi:MAG: EthD domain-containing protein [Chloroflexota bacterium]